MIPTYGHFDISLNFAFNLPGYVSSYMPTQVKQESKKEIKKKNEKKQYTNSGVQRSSLISF